MQKKRFNLLALASSALLASSLLTVMACSANDDSSTAQGTTDEDIITDYVASNYSYPMVTTGQTATYDNDGQEVTLSRGDACYGQDGNYQAGAPMSFTDNGDGTVTDNNTGLMWQQIPTSTDFTYAEAVAYCDSLSLAGHTDWRVPSLKELFSISDFNSGWPYIDTNVFTLASGTVIKDEQYWSNNEYVGITVEGGENAVFGVNHVTGHIKAYPGVMPEGDDDLLPSSGAPSGTNDEATGTLPPPPAGSSTMPGEAPTGNPMAKYVRAVRSISPTNSYGVNKFKDNGNKTVTDEATGLMWSQEDSQEGLDWEDALEYAESSTLAGYDDWRLPNVKELQSIADYNYSPSATDADHVGAAIDPDYFTCTPIINENGDSDYPYYWTSTSARFQEGGDYYYAWYLAAGRAVNAEGLDFHGAGAVRFDTKYEGGEAGEGGERYENYVRLVRNAD